MQLLRQMRCKPSKSPFTMVRCSFSPSDLDSKAEAGQLTLSYYLGLNI